MKRKKKKKEARVSVMPRRRRTPVVSSSLFSGEKRKNKESGVFALKTPAQQGRVDCQITFPSRNLYIVKKKKKGKKKKERGKNVVFFRHASPLIGKHLPLSSEGKKKKEGKNEGGKKGWSRSPARPEARHQMTSLIFVIERKRKGKKDEEDAPSRKGTQSRGELLILCSIRLSQVSRRRKKKKGKRREKRRTAHVSSGNS